MSLRIELLGRPRIQRDGETVDLEGRRPLALLAYLVVTRQRHTRQHLIDLLFDGPDDPRAALRWTLSKLRKAIGEGYLLTEREEVAFNFESDHWVDVAEFEAGELELYQGDFLEGLYLREALPFEDWLGFERGRLRGLYQAGLEKQLESQRREGEHPAVVLTAQGLLKLDNLREDWHCALMEAYARLGKRSTALEQYERCCQALRSAWGIDPRPETVALREAIRCGEIGPPIIMISNESHSTVVSAGPPEMAPVKGSQRTRRVFSRPILPFVGVFGLVAALLLFFGEMTWLDRRANPAGGGQPVMDGLADQPEAPGQSFADATVWILGPFQDTKTRLFQQSMMPLEERTGIDVVFMTGEMDYDLDLARRLESGELPDIVVFAQPAWLETLAKQGKIINLSTFLEDDYLKQQYPEAFIDLVRMDGQVLGVWHTIDLKSLVWYPKRAFEAKGYEVPETWDELIALSDRIVADGGVPWCIGIEGAEGTGWIGTDWVEDILLRTTPPETYDAWVSHELPFNSPEIRHAFEIMGQIWLNDDYVYGGTANISELGIFDSPLPIVDDPPGCYLHKQASFGVYFFPDEAKFGVDYDFFYLPPIDPEFGRPVLVSGVLFAMVKDRPEVREVMRYLTTAESTETLIKNGGFLSPHRETPMEWFQSTADLRFAQIVLSADTYRFDGSDLMPDQVGLGSFYKGITDWVEGAELETVLQEIDASWQVE